MRGRRLGRVLAGGLLLALLSAAPAAAHNGFVSSDPADGATLPRTPAAVVLTFDEPAIALGTRVEVTGPGGSVDRGAAQLVDETVRQDLTAGAPPGRYTVAWRVTSADGHPVTGQLTFTTEAAGAGQPVAPAENPAAPVAPASPAWSWVVVALVLLASAGGVSVLRRRRGHPTN
jgi:methionine-rich copper-binding protein CopC